jgi:hypothetical protein
LPRTPDSRLLAPCEPWRAKYSTGCACPPGPRLIYPSRLLRVWPACFGGSYRPRRVENVYGSFSNAQCVHHAAESMGTAGASLAAASSCRDVSVSSASLGEHAVDPGASDVVAGDADSAVGSVEHSSSAIGAGGGTTASVPAGESDSAFADSSDLTRTSFTACCARTSASFSAVSAASGANASRSQLGHASQLLINSA